MSEDVTPYAPTPLAFPETHLTSERLWVGSALSVLRARQAVYPPASLLAGAYTHALLALDWLACRLREEEDNTDALTD